MKIRSMAIAVLMAGAAMAPSASADETTFCNVYITTLPYTISTQGHYCFNRNLSTAITSGNAITIASDFVVLDLNNFKLGGGSAGTGTDAVGVYASNRSNLTVRNGNIRGFAFGIALEGTTDTGAQNVVVENNAVDGNLKAGIIVAGRGGLVRNNLVSNTGGSTSATPYCGGIAAGISQAATQCTVFAHSGDVVSNTVSNTASPVGAAGILFFSTTSSSAIDNVVRDVDSPTDARGIEGDSGEIACKGNLVQGATLPYLGCTLVGTTNYP
jgi:parallel beta-helix repeat protein